MRLGGVVGIGGALLLAAVAARAEDDGVAASPPPAADPWADVAVVPLWKAVAAGDVEASGSQPASYRAVRLALRNRTRERVAVDVAGSHLRPRSRGSCQRLGLGPPVVASETTSRGAGTSVVLLEPGAEREFVVNTCCLDAGLPAPASHGFVAVAEPLPAVREKVLRWWVDNPTAPQGAVNSAIWGFSDTVHIGPGVVAHYLVPTGRFAALHRGVFYRLVDGELTSVDADGVVRILGTGIFQVLPADDAVYAVALGEDRKPKLFRLSVTGDDPWKRILDLDATNRIHDLHAGRGGDLVLVTDKGIDFFDHETCGVRRALASEQLVHISVRRENDERLTITTRRPPREPVYQGGQRLHEAAPVFELWSLDAASGATERDEEFWNIGSMLAGSGGVFALAHTTGRLRRLVRGKFDEFGPDATFTRILGISRDVVWLVDAEDRVVAVDARTGKRRFRTESRGWGLHVFDVDSESGDLAYVDGEEFRRISAVDGTETTLLGR